MVWMLIEWIRDLFAKRAVRLSAPPPLSAEMQSDIRATINTTLSQIGQVIGPEYKRFPPLSDWHEDLVASYALGFLAARFLFSQSDRKWAKGDRGLADLGFVVAAGALVAGLFESDSVIRLAERLPQLRGEGPTDQFRLADGAGGTDGLAHAAGEPLPKGGQLAYLLRENLDEVERRAIATVAEVRRSGIDMPFTRVA